MEWIELGKLANVETGKLNANAADEDGKYPFFTCAEEISRINDYKYDKECILIAGNGNLNVKYYSGKFNAYQRTYIVESKDKKTLSTMYLYYFMNTYMDKLRELSIGGVIKYIKLGHLQDAKIPVPPMEIQEKIVKALDQAQALIDKRKEQIEALDQLIESIFYTMFGDPVRNEKGWEVKEVQHLGKVGSSRRVYLSECVNEGIPFYRGQEVSRLSYGKKPNNELFISPDHYEELKAQRGIPKKGDLLLPSICPDGDIWMVDTNEPFYFKDGRVLWVELEDENINNFFIKSTLAHILRRNFRGISSGSTFSELKIFLLEKITIPIPPLALQNEFADKVETIEKQKEVLRESLELLEENYKSIMDKAFKGQLFN